jgi:hypothetical protein
MAAIAAGQGTTAFAFSRNALADLASRFHLSIISKSEKLFGRRRTAGETAAVVVETGSKETRFNPVVDVCRMIQWTQTAIAAA